MEKNIINTQNHTWACESMDHFISLLESHSCDELIMVVRSQKFAPPSNQEFSCAFFSIDKKQALRFYCINFKIGVKLYK